MKSVTVVKSPRSIGRTLLGVSIVGLSLLMLNLYLWVITPDTNKINPFDYRWTRHLKRLDFEDIFGRSDLWMHGLALLAIWALVAGMVMAIRGHKKVNPSA